MKGFVDKVNAYKFVNDEYKKVINGFYEDAKTDPTKMSALREFSKQCDEAGGLEKVDPFHLLDIYDEMLI